MATDPALQRQINRLTEELARTQAEVRTLRRGARRPQLGRSSIDSGALEVRDPETGATRLRLGYQPDGSVGVVPEGGDPPPEPTTPSVEPIGSGLSVRWDGRLLGGVALPGDFDHVNVYVSRESGFTPTGGTFQGTIHRDGGSLPVAPLEVGVRHYARLVGVGTGGVQGPPSEQSSGVPESVTDIEPGSITETEIADDAISTPKIQAEAIQALHIAAEQIEAGHIQAAAVTASKLEADLVLGTRIIAGTPGGARVELDGSGLRGYTGSDQLAFAIDDQGNATFSGVITGSQIFGSSIHITSPEGAEGQMAAVDEQVMTRMYSADGSRAQLIATDEAAEFSAWGDPDSGTGPAGGMTAWPSQIALNLYSDTSAIASAPMSYIQASPGQAYAGWAAGTGSEVRIRAIADWCGISVAPPQASDPDDHQTEGMIYGQRLSSDLATLTLAGPQWWQPGHEPHERRALVFMEGARPERPYTRVAHHARVHRFGPEYLGQGQGYDYDNDGSVQLASTHSLSAPRHAPVRTDMSSQPTADSTGDWVDFTSSQMPPITWRTGASGRVRVTVQTCAINNRTNASTISLSFRLSGASTVPESLARAAMVRSTGSSSAASSARQSGQVVYLDLPADSEVTLTPSWRISGSGHPWDGVQAFDLNYQNSIIVENLP